MPADFAMDLCGYRDHGKPNTSDKSDAFSVELGQALFDELGVQPGAPGTEPTGSPFAERVADDLHRRVAEAGGSLLVRPEQPLNAFDQFRHVGALRAMRPEPSKEFTRAWQNLMKFMRPKVSNERDAKRLAELSAAVDAALDSETESRRLLLEEIGDESLLKLDVTASRDEPRSRLPSLEIGLSLKWSLRTDRAQDCRTQGSKIAALRRGPMPHFAAVTMEPRPYMLNLLGGGSGDVDCVYHLNLPALTAAVEAVCAGRPRRKKTLETFHRLVAQRRVRDYDELVELAVRV